MGIKGLIMTNVNDPKSRNCKMCGTVAHRQSSGYKRGFRKYKCSGDKCGFNWQERDKSAPATKKEVGNLDQWAKKHHIGDNKMYERLYNLLIEGFMHETPPHKLSGATRSYLKNLKTSHKLALKRDMNFRSGDYDNPERKKVEKKLNKTSRHHVRLFHAVPQSPERKEYRKINYRRDRDKKDQAFWDRVKRGSKFWNRK